MSTFSIKPSQNSFQMLYRIKQINVLSIPLEKPLLILIINLYNRTSIISFYIKKKKVFRDFNPCSEIIKIKLTNLQKTGTFLKNHKKSTYLIILTPFSLILYHVFLQRKLREIKADNGVLSHKYSFDDFLIIPLENSNMNDFLDYKGKNQSKFLILTSSNDCTIRIWNLMNGNLLKLFTSQYLNKNFLYFPSEKHENINESSYILSIFNAKIFNQVKIELNVWDWRTGNLKKTLRNFDFRSVIQIELLISFNLRYLLLIGGIEKALNYKICVFDWKGEVLVRKIEGLGCFNFFMVKNQKKGENENRILLFNKNNVSCWDMMGVRRRTVLECKEEVFNFTSGVVNKEDERIVIAKGLDVYFI